MCQYKTETPSCILTVRAAGSAEGYGAAETEVGEWEAAVLRLCKAQAP